jgi:predicted DNA-binding helix-hairpin-helix protein
MLVLLMSCSVMCGIAREQLLLIPGIGLQSTSKIVAARRDTRLHDLFQLKILGVTT